MTAFHEATVAILEYVLDEQRRDLKLHQDRLEQADETSLKTRAERERFPKTVATFHSQITMLTAVVADFEELLRLIEQGNADEAEQDRQIAEDDARNEAKYLAGMTTSLDRAPLAVAIGDV